MALKSALEIKKEYNYWIITSYCPTILVASETHILERRTGELKWVPSQFVIDEPSLSSTEIIDTDTYTVHTR